MRAVHLLGLPCALCEGLAELGGLELDFLGLLKERFACVQGGDDGEGRQDRGAYRGDLLREDLRHGGSLGVR